MMPSHYSLGLRLLLVLVTVLTASTASAKLTYSKEDMATVRVMAVQGVVGERVATKRNPKATLAVVKAGHGSGTVISADGVILTAAHVVDDAEFIAVMVPGRPGALMARLLYTNKKRDIAFLKVTGVFTDFVPLPTSEPQLAVRQQVFALGYPIDGTRAYPQSTAGVVSGTMPDGDLQLGISVNPGNSGGPLIDASGNLVGVVVKSSDTTKGVQGIAVAAQIELARRYYEKRVVGSPRLARAQADVAKMRKQGDAARVIAEIASVSSLGAAIKYIETTDEGLRQALRGSQKSHGSHPDFLAILSAHYWNESLVRFALDGKDWKPPLQEASRLAKRAAKLDAAVVHRSPFVYSAAGMTKKLEDAPRRAAPRQAAGFRLGWSVQEAREVCEIDDLVFTKRKSSYSCSGSPASADVTGPVALQFCDGQLCKIVVFDKPSNQLSDVWVSRFKESYKSFENRYGKHTSKSIKMPKSCRANILDCLEDGSARFIYRWKWNERGLKLSMGRIAGKPTFQFVLEDVSSAK